MSQGESIVQSLLSGIEFGDSRLYDALLQMASDIARVDNQLNPPSVVGVFGLTGQVIVPSTVTSFASTLYNNNLHLSWDAIAGLVTYEIRYKIGSGSASDWNAASVLLRTSTLGVDINPLTVPLTIGNHTFLIKSINSAGTYSDVASLVVINIPIIASPAVSATVITNFVLLNWSIPSSIWLIDHYNVYKNGILQGTVSGTFEAIFETVGGVFTYVIVPVDIVGNIGSASNGITVSVSNPVDFTLHSQLNSTFTGAKVNCYAYTDLALV